MILVGCEYSGTVRDAFIEAGYDAWSCDLLPTEGKHTRRHIQGDIRDVIEGRLGPRHAKWSLGVFFPDCTYLCSSGLHWNKRVPGRAAKTEEALGFVRYLMSTKIPRWALENPTGCISTRIRKPDQVIQPYNFGADASKGTCLWLHELPKLEHGEFVEPRLVCGYCRSTSVYGERVP